MGDSYESRTFPNKTAIILQTKERKIINASEMDKKKNKYIFYDSEVIIK